MTRRLRPPQRVGRDVAVMSPLCRRDTGATSPLCPADVPGTSAGHPRDIRGQVGTIAAVVAPSSRRAKSTARKPTEAAEQQVLAQWLVIKRLLWCHVPNGGLRSWSEARRFKAMGVMPGVPDLLVFSQPSRACVGDGGAGDLHIVGAAIELKRQGVRSCSPEQRTWLEALGRVGWAAKVCAGAHEAISWLESLGY